MNKIFLGKPLVKSTTEISLWTVVLSWITNWKINEKLSTQELNYIENEITLEDSDLTTETNINKIEGSENPLHPKDAINEMADEVQFDYLNKLFVLAQDAIVKGIQSTGYDKDVYEVLIETILRHPDDHSIDIFFQLKNKLSYETSQLTFATIYGFKDWGTDENLDSVAKSTNWNYPNKENTFAKDVKFFKFQSSNHDTEKYATIVKRVSHNNDEGFTRITFAIKDKTTGKISNIFSRKIRGFKMKNSNDEIDDVAGKIVFDYIDKQNMLASDAEEYYVQTSNYDKKRYHVHITEFTPMDAKRLVRVIYYILDKVERNFSDTLTKRIEGFKAPDISRQTLNDEVNKVIVDVPERNTILASDWDLNDMIFTGFDESKFSILTSNTKPNDAAGTLTVRFRVVEEENPFNQSDIREVVLAGFKKP